MCTQALSILEKLAPTFGRMSGTIAEKCSLVYNYINFYLHKRFSKNLSRFIEHMKSFTQVNTITPATSCHNCSDPEKGKKIPGKHARGRHHAYNVHIPVHQPGNQWLTGKQLIIESQWRIHVTPVTLEMSGEYREVLKLICLITKEQTYVCYTINRRHLDRKLTLATYRLQI